MKLVTTQKSKHSNRKPPIIKWKTEHLLRKHALGDFIDKLVSRSKNTEVVRITLVGDTGTGKTTLADVIAHLFHEKADVPYTVRHFNREDLVNLKKTISTLEPMNHIIIFDDISFLNATHTNQHIAMIQQMFSEIRHLEGGQDIKIIGLMLFHYAVALPPYLRQAHYTFYTQIGSSDVEPMSKSLHVSHKQIDTFQNILEAASEEKQFTVAYGSRNTAKGKKSLSHTYIFREPFAPAFLWSKRKNSIIVYPHIDWLTPHCHICTTSEKIANQQTIDNFKSDASKRFGPHVVKEALRAKGIIHGIFSHRPRVKQATQYIEEFLKANSDVTLGHLMDFYKLRVDKTYLPDGIPKELKALRKARDESE